MPSILVRGLDEKTIERLKEKAKRNGRSLQSEAKRVLEEAAEQTTWAEVRAMADESRKKLAGRQFPDSVELLREDRER